MTPERQRSVSYITGEAIDRLVGRIVEDVHPLRVLLVGSATRGELAAGSDIDLLVVIPDGTHRRRTAQHLYRRLHGIGIPVDILVATRPENGMAGTVRFPYPSFLEPRGPE